jgi:hypothetical protein
MAILGISGWHYSEMLMPGSSIHFLTVEEKILTIKPNIEEGVRDDV